MDLLAERITQSINDLALQIDILYKLTEKDRQSFLNKIQTFKTTLLGLKSSLKISNKELVQSQYKGVRCEIIEMKRFLDVKLQELRFKNANQQNRSIHQNRLNSCKIGNRNGSITKVNESLFDTSGLGMKSQLNGSRIGVMKHISKKEYEELMKNIVQKSQTNQQLTDELMILRQQNSQIKQINEALKCKAELYQAQKQNLQVQFNSLSYKFQNLEKRLNQRQSQFAQLKESELQNRTRNSRSALELSQLRNQLEVANQKLLNYSNFEQIHSYKASLLQSDLSKYQRQILLLNQEHQRKEMELHKKIKQLQAFQQNYNESLKKINKLETQLQNQKQDIEVLESQLTKSQKLFYQLKISKENVQTTLQMQQKTFSQQSQQQNKQIQMLKEMLVDSEQFNSVKQIEISSLKAKLSEWEQVYLEERMQRQKLQEIFGKNQAQFQKQRQAYICDLELKKIQISKLSDQVKKSLQLTRTLQDEINQNHRNRTSIRENNKVLSNDLKNFQIQNIQLNKSYQQLKQMYLEAIEHLNLKECQLQTTKKSMKSLQSQLKDAKIRLHKAKIQAINDIRNTLF